MVVIYFKVFVEMEGRGGGTMLGGRPAAKSVYLHLLIAIYVPPAPSLTNESNVRRDAI